MGNLSSSPKALNKSISVMPPDSLLDQQALDNLRALSPDDEDAFLKEILAIYLEDTPVRLNELNTYLKAGKAEDFIRAAHSIKGSSSNVGASEVRRLAEELEHYVRLNGLPKADKLLENLETAFDRIKSSVLTLL
jgi:histidine phosphotransfer protein HptB